MEIKKYKEQKQEQIKVAEEGLAIIKEMRKIEKQVPIMDSENIEDITKTERDLSIILQDPEEAANQKVVNIASMVSQIKELDMDPKDPIVSNWAEKELGINEKELQQLLNGNDTPQEVEQSILELMEVPERVMDSVKENTKAQKKKS